MRTFIASMLIIAVVNPQNLEAFDIPDFYLTRAGRHMHVMQNYGGPSMFDKPDAELGSDMAIAIYSKIDEFTGPENWRGYSRETKLRDLQIRILDYISQEHASIRESPETAGDLFFKINSYLVVFLSSPRNAAEKRKLTQQTKRVIHRMAEDLLKLSPFP